MTTIITVGVLKLSSAKDGSRTGVIDVCRDTEGNVHLRINRLGNEVVIMLAPSIALQAAALIEKATRGGES